MRVLLGTVAVLLAGVVLSPLSLSAHDIIEWAGSRTGLGLYGSWPYVVFYALDATATACVLITVYAAWRAEKGGVFRVLVWVIAAASAFANYRHGLRPGAPADAWWFFPAMSLSSPVLLEAVLHKARNWIRAASGRTAQPMPSFGVARWIPGVGALTETYGAWRVARLLGISRPDTAITEYRRLCPNGGARVLRAIQAELRVRQTGQTTDRPVRVRQTGQTTDRPVRVRQTGQTTDRPVRVRQTGQTTDNSHLAKIRAEWPTEIPSGNKIRVLLGVNYEIAKRLLTQLREERQAA